MIRLSGILSSLRMELETTERGAIMPRLQEVSSEIHRFEEAKIA
jgi:hypothetical protein